MSDGMKSVLITGGASGIGLEIARLLHERGWRVYLMDRNADALADACRAIPIDPAQAIACSVTDEKEVESAIATAAAAGAPLRAVINSAGIAMDRPAVETSVDDFRRILDVNLTGTFIVCREAGASLAGDGHPRCNRQHLLRIRPCRQQGTRRLWRLQRRGQPAHLHSRDRARTGWNSRQRHRSRCNRHAFVARRPYG